MTVLLRGLSALLGMTFALAGSVLAQDTTSLETDRERISYAVGVDVSRSLAAFHPDIDLDTFERALRQVMGGGEPILGAAEAAALQPALRQRAAARSGGRIPGLAPGSAPPEVDRGQVGLLLGADVGRSLLPLAGELDPAIVVQALRTSIAGGEPLLSQQQLQEASRLLQAHMQARAARVAEDNRKAGAEFLATNRTAKGVFTTGSGLQYQILRQGSGNRPLPTDTVRVQYHGTLLDGTVFDSSYQRGTPAEFALRQVIAGWTEGLMLMPVGAKYRFWIPSELGYGSRGSPPIIGPDATLVFDVELLDIL